jgi:hypothetical protein
MKLVILSEFFHPDDFGSTPTRLSELCRHLRDHYPEIDRWHH